MANHNCRSCQEDWSCTDIVDQVVEQMEDADMDRDEIDDVGCRFHEPDDYWASGLSRRTGRRLYSCPSCYPEWWRGHVFEWLTGQTGDNPMPLNARIPIAPPDPNACHCNRCG